MQPKKDDLGDRKRGHVLKKAFPYALLHLDRLVQVLNGIEEFLYYIFI
jgi:hypothetical protein